jgi:zinc transporter 2
MHSHSSKCHSTSTDQDIKKILKVLVVVFFFMMLEIWGHYQSNSLSLLADSIHLLVDFLGFLVSLSALKWTQKKPTRSMTFGYSRIEIIGALFSIFLIWAATGYLLIESYQKIKNPKEINSKIFMTISIVGFFVNLFCLYALHDHHEMDGEKRNLNIRAAYIHVIGDLIQSVGIIIASIITYVNPRLVIVDIICTLFFSVLVLISTFYVVKDALNILIERSPGEINQVKIKDDLLRSIQNIEEILRFHVWNISSNIKAINVHLKLKEIWKYDTGMIEAKKLLYDKYGFDFVCIQFDTNKTKEFIPKKEIETQFRCKKEQGLSIEVEKIAMRCFNNEQI